MSNLIRIDGKELKKFGFSTTGANFLLTLGYAYHSAERKDDTYKIEATLEDHDRLIDQVESVEFWITDSTKAVGAALAAVNFDEINEDSIRGLGYLISGLGELQMLIKNTRDVIEESKGGAMIDYTQRLEGYNYKEPEAFSLVNSVNSASGRAEAIITMLQGDFIEGMNELNNETIFSALDAVRLECIDIKNTVEQ